MQRHLLAIILLLGTLNSFAQAPIKKLQAVKTDKSIKIDGDITDEAWKDAPIATGFIEFRPTPGKVEKHEQRTEVKLLYDNTAIYIAARMYEHPDSIEAQIVTRDQVGNADFIGVIFDTYRDRINGFGFYVTAAGSQYDARYSQTGNEDDLWNAVWDSDVKRDKDGWTAEMRIPYSALRFDNKEVQDWGLNFTRRRQRINQQSTWNNLDPKVSGFVPQFGDLIGIEKVTAPVRLAFSPYISSYVNHYPINTPNVSNTTGSFNGGMDVKYGINESFTLDMTLIPDFGQVQSDNQILNLSPFEVKFDERRQFFTEGTELFNKGELFYSRRIGSRPLNFYNVEGQLLPGETIVKNPGESRLINASKLSGRTAKGLGIGLFNAMTNTMRATIEDASGNRRYIETQPFTNYNILVFDQNLKNNSSVSFVNTNVLRQGSAYDANVTALLFDISNKENKYFVSGGTKMSYLSKGQGTEASTGYGYDFKAGKKSGNLVYNFRSALVDNKFDNNDLGILFNNNFWDNSTFIGYNVYKPNKWFNSFESWFETYYSRRYRPSDFQSFEVALGAWTTLKNFAQTHFNMEWSADGNDFYEARNGQMFRTSQSYGFDGQYSSNRAKRYNAGVFYEYEHVVLNKGNSYEIGFYQNLRISNKLSLGNDFVYNPQYNYTNWVGFDGNAPVFSTYNRQTIENSIDALYSFSPRMGISFRARHYWSTRDNKDYFNLNSDGTLSPRTGGTPFANLNFNTFNIDMIYTWQFAPGSELSIAWKDASLISETGTTRGYFRNFDRIMSTPQNNSLSVKVLYYVDYLQLRKRRT